MKPNFARILFTAATELASGGGASVSTETAPEAAAAAEAAPEPAPAPAAAEPVSVTEPTFLEKVSAGLKDKAALVNENIALKARAEKAESDNLALISRLDGLLAEITDLREERAKIAAALTTAETAAVTVEEAAAAQVAAIGFEAAALPDGVKPGETKEELQAELDRTTDDKRRYELAARIWELSWN